MILCFATARILYRPFDMKNHAKHEPHLRVPLGSGLKTWWWRLKNECTPLNQTRVYNSSLCTRLAVCFRPLDSNFNVGRAINSETTKECSYKRWNPRSLARCFKRQLLASRQGPTQPFSKYFNAWRSLWCQEWHAWQFCLDTFRVNRSCKLLHIAPWHQGFFHTKMGLQGLPEKLLGLQSASAFCL